MITFFDEFFLSGCKFFSFMSSCFVKLSISLNVLTASLASIATTVIWPVMVSSVDSSRRTGLTMALGFPNVPKLSTFSTVNAIVWFSIDSSNVFDNKVILYLCRQINYSKPIAIDGCGAQTHVLLCVLNMYKFLYLYYYFIYFFLFWAANTIQPVWSGPVTILKFSLKLLF